MTRSFSPLFAGALDYLRELGYEELYRPVRRGEFAASGDSATAPPAEERASALAALEGRAATCTQCGLSEGRSKVVFGSGDPNADLMFVGEGPGAEEDRQGLPFVGPAGELLTKIIQAIELDRGACYIANVVKCRPPRNRDPLPEETGACRAYLEQQIDLVRPKIVVALGRVAAQNLLQKESTLSALRGRWYEVRGVPVRVTYHPAALLRNTAYKRPTWEDMQIVRDRLAELHTNPHRD